MHPPDNEGIENGKQCLYDYVDYMEDSACGSSSEGMEPLDLNVTNVSNKANTKCGCYIVK